MRFHPFLPSLDRRSVALTVVVLAVLWGGGPLGASEPEDPALALQRATSALAAGEAELAEARYRALLEEHPGLVGAHRGLSRALVALGRQDEAVRGLRGLGEGLLGAGRYRDAIEVLREAVKLDPDGATLRIALGRALMLDQNFGDAVPHLRQAVELGASGPATRVYLGLAQWESGQLEEAEATLRAVAQAGSGVSRQQLGRFLLWRGEYGEAVELLRQAALTEPGSVDRQVDLARALEGAGQMVAALEVYERAISLAGDRYPPRYSRARVLMRLGRREEARQELARYEELYRRSQARLRDEGTLRARLDRGWELLAANDARQAAELFAAFPDQIDALVGVALARSSLGEHAGAVDALERAVTLAPERQDLRLMLLEERQANGTS